MREGFLPSMNDSVNLLTNLLVENATVMVFLEVNVFILLNKRTSCRRKSAYVKGAVETENDNRLCH